MLSWLKKFVLDIMPSVAATIIGAYIVNHYIVPKSPAAQQAALSSTAEPKSPDTKVSDSKGLDLKGSDLKSSDLKGSDSKNSDVKSADDKSGGDKTGFEKTGFEKAVAEKAAIEKVVEKAAADKSESAKHHAPAKLASKPVNDERRANDLARAAIERLRNTSPTDQAKSETGKLDQAKIEPAKVDPAKADVAKADPKAQPVTTAVLAPPMQPLPPAITLTTPNANVFEQGAAAPVVRQPFPQTASRSDDSQRLLPPGEIPGRSPLDLRAEAMASSSSSTRTSVADDVVSVAKSVFHAVIPR
jgi:hypothetical protein